MAKILPFKRGKKPPKGFTPIHDTIALPDDVLMASRRLRVEEGETAHAWRRTGDGHIEFQMSRMIAQQRFGMGVKKVSLKKKPTVNTRSRDIPDEDQGIKPPPRSV